MSLSNLFQSARIARWRPDGLPKWMSASMFLRLSARGLGVSRADRFPASICAALFAALILQFALPSQAALPDDPAIAPREPPLPGAGPALAFPVVLARPVFAPDRKAVAPLAAPSSLDGYEVLGIAISAEKATALVRGPDGKTQRILYGGTLDGWRLASVDRAQIVFEKDGQNRPFVLHARPAVRPVPTRSAQARPQTGDDDTESSQ
jgi:hypothetical protein